MVCVVHAPVQTDAGTVNLQQRRGTSPTSVVQHLQQRTFNFWRLIVIVNMYIIIRYVGRCIVCPDLNMIKLQQKENNNIKNIHLSVIRMHEN